MAVTALDCARQVVRAAGDEPVAESPMATIEAMALGITIAHTKKCPPIDACPYGGDAGRCHECWRDALLDKAAQMQANERDG